MLSRSTLTAAFALTVLSSCTDADAPPENEPSDENELDGRPFEDETPDSTAVPDDEAPAWYAKAEPMPSCGQFDMDEIRLDNAELEEANRCLMETFEDGDAAQLEVALMTDEGDPIMVTYRVIGEQRLEKLVDARADEHGRMDFGYAVCNELVEDRPRRGSVALPEDCEWDETRTVPPPAR